MSLKVKLWTVDTVVIAKLIECTSIPINTFPIAVLGNYKIDREVCGFYITAQGLTLPYTCHQEVACYNFPNIYLRDKWLEAIHELINTLNKENNSPVVDLS